MLGDLTFNLWYLCFSEFACVNATHFAENNCSNSSCTGKSPGASGLNIRAENWQPLLTQSVGYQQISTLVFTHVLGRACLWNVSGSVFPLLSSVTPFWNVITWQCYVWFFFSLWFWVFCLAFPLVLVLVSCPATSPSPPTSAPTTNASSSTAAPTLPTTPGNNPQITAVSPSWSPS